MNSTNELTNSFSSSQDDRLLTVSEAADFLHIRPGSLYHLISQHRIPVIRISSRCVRFSRVVLQEWIESLSQDADEFSNGDRKSTSAIRKLRSSVNALGHK